jgi:glutathione S-transferase
MKWCYLKYDKNSSQGTLSLAEKALSYRWVKYDLNSSKG